MAGFCRDGHIYKAIIVIIVQVVSCDKIGSSIVDWLAINLDAIRVHIYICNTFTPQIKENREHV